MKTDLSNDQTIGVWPRLEAWSPDEPQAAFPFSSRLARENAWTNPYALRVIREYKRFACLAVVAGHPVTPSDQVDQVWHLHLLYTKSYWEDFCPNVLGCKLHHSPTKGGADQQLHFRGNYERTRCSYRRIFGEDPPADIWPDTEQRFSDIYFVRTNKKRNWVIHKPCWLSAIGLTLWLGYLRALYRRTAMRAARGRKNLVGRMRFYAL